ncbi:hypothetical protein [Rhizobium sp. Root149]|uniref:hypothetical protein n=1 Tax=Rhizobium sp. Root149 TaxID=1736473 RepID=UPI000ACB36DB|nr:hypothetical protein [Rhizobium sp. Root149]
MAIKIAEAPKPTVGERLAKSTKQAAVVAKEHASKTGRPKSDNAKERTTLYLDKRILEH